MFLVLFACLGSLLILDYLLFKKDIIAPAFVFVLSFAFSCLWAFSFYEEWQLDTFQPVTFHVIFGGVIVFTLVAFLVNKIMNHRSANIPILSHLEEIKISGWIKIVCLVFACVTILACLYSILRATGYSWGNVLAAIYRYDQANKFSAEGVGIGRIPSLMRLVTIALSYWSLYVVINNFIVNKRLDFIMITVIILGLVASMTTGGRNAAFNILFATPAFVFILIKKDKTEREKSNASKKATRYLLIAAIILLSIFPKLTSVIGRSTSKTDTYYLAVYCGAEIKNLDTFLTSYPDNVAKDKNNMTFKNLNNWLRSKLKYASTYKYDLPFNTVGKYTLGNVYTTFYAYIYDYGYIGMASLTALMAFLSQLIYEKALRAKVSSRPSLIILTYGYILSSIALSFFSNKFYEQNFNITFFYTVACWFVFNELFIGKNSTKESREK